MDYIEITQTAFMVIIASIGVAILGIVFGLLYKGFDRKFTALMQRGIGPALLQPFLDIRKLFVKDNIIPRNAISWLFNLAPVLGLASTITVLLYLPIGGFSPILDGFIAGKGDMILILYLLMIPSLAMITGGFSSGSPYATVGAQREMATMIAYEFPLAIVIISIAWRFSLVANVSHVFSIATISSTPIWSIVGPVGFIGAIILLITLFIITPPPLFKIPFDLSKAATEKTEGLLAEYSGRNLAMFYLTDGVKLVAMGTLIIALFFPFNLSPILGLSSIPAIAVDFIFYLFKLLIVITFSVNLIRAVFARLKIDQMLYTYWVPLTLLGLVGLICMMWDQTIMTQFELSTVFEMLGL
jgi:formate hydrogenlyase subunit 4